MSLEERLAAASAFLVQSPPGEINDVFADLRALVGDDPALEHAILPALRQYNLEQYVVAQRPGAAPSPAAAKVVVTPDSHLADDRHVDWANRTTFAFDHMAASASDFQEIARRDLYDEPTLAILDGVAKVFGSHCKNHYHDAVSAVYPLEDERYPTPEPVAAPTPVEAQATNSEVDDVETGEKQGEDQGEAMGAAVSAGLAEGLPESALESAEVAAETAEVAEAATAPDDATVPDEVTAGDETEPMDIGTPAQPNVEPETETATETESAAIETAEVELPLKASRKYAMYLVGNKYNPNNYWTGRWRSKYVLDHETGQLDGTAQINIHYYEQGNVQLATTLHCSNRLSPNPSPEQVVASIKQSEQTFSSSLSSTYSNLSDETFKGLRRALPKTRSKIDWNKAGGYRLGHELGGQSA